MVPETGELQSLENSRASDFPASESVPGVQSLTPHGPPGAEITIWGTNCYLNSSQTHPEITGRSFAKGQRHGLVDGGRASKIWVMTTMVSSGEV